MSQKRELKNPMVESPLGEVPLLPHGVGLLQPLSKLFVDIIWLLESKDVDMAARRERLDASKARAHTSPRQHDVSVEPRPPWRQLSKGHPHMERNAALFGKHFDRSNLADCSDDGLKECANLGPLPHKVVIEIVAPARM